jgi:hypothetical protein
MLVRFRKIAALAASLVFTTPLLAAQEKPESPESRETTGAKEDVEKPESGRKAYGLDSSRYPLENPLCGAPFRASRQLARWKQGRLGRSSQRQGGSGIRQQGSLREQP